MGGDVLKRKKYADFLTHYLASKEQPFVLNVNSPWGTGKTFFIEKWHEDLDGVYPTVLFNAWKNDYSNDPLLSVISCINKTLIPLLPETEKAKTTVTKFLINGCRMFKKVAPILMKAAASKAIGDGGVKELSDISSDDKKIYTGTLEKLTKELLSSNQKEERSVKDFQIALGTMVELLTIDNKKKHLTPPLFIFIDELDRCRPLYAIELLEKIKHLLGIPCVVFVIATDTEQLKHSINAIYGNNFKSGVYLRRFFNQIYTLPPPNIIEFSKLTFKGFKSNSKFYNYRISPTGNPLAQIRDHNAFKESDEYTLKIDDVKFLEHVLIFALFSDFFKLDMRSQKQCYEKILAILSVTPENEEIQFLYLTFLVMLEAKDSALFEKYFNLAEGSYHKRAASINDNYNSLYNVRVGVDKNYASNFVDFFSKYCFSDEDELMGYVNARGEKKQSWVFSIRNNLNGIKQYKERVMLACELTSDVD